MSACAQNTKEVKVNKVSVVKETEIVKDSISSQKLMKLSKTAAIQQYGAPASKEQFTLGEAYGEFRNNITNTYISDQRAPETIFIEELTWEKDQDTWITVWYEVQDKKSIPKETYIWDKGTEF
ncbi:hypothetical protein ATO12_15900 [Aquimarina atlantica]|uniref:Uncharacterized protein n=2 Tax=Aquimarina atlantica TaxID=1317122 RepID=A0A023BTT2_9FLAO|nr:hypothetical protein ATO12_15900 [Aquimarina atlantica]